MKNLPQKVRSKKLNSKIDLTAMVSVSFLLIIFFMVVGELSKPKMIDLSMPGRHCDEEFKGISSCGAGTDTRLITMLLDENDKIVMYSGLLFDPIGKAIEIDYGKNGIRKELFNKKKMILDFSSSIGRPNNGPIVIIKPSKKSNFKNLVDILNEMAAARIETYAIVPEYTPEEAKLLVSK